MHPQGHHVAQLNIGQLRHPINDPRTAGFADTTAAMQVEGVVMHDVDPCAIQALSVWQTPQAYDFVNLAEQAEKLERAE